MQKLLIITASILLLAACGLKKSENENSNKPIVSVSILPQKYFVEQLAGDLVDVSVLLPPGASPASYDPSPKQLTKLSKANTHFYVGDLAFEKAWLDKLKSSAPNTEFIACNKNVDIIEGACDHNQEAEHIHTEDCEHATKEEHVHSEECEHNHASTDSDDHAEHKHDEGHDHDAENHQEEKEVLKTSAHDSHQHDVDPHIWMSTKNAKKIVTTIYVQLCNILPEKKSEFTENYKVLLAKINELDEQIKSNLKAIDHPDFMIYHPALGYFSRDYGLIQHAIEYEGKSPSPAHMKNMIDLANSKHIHAIFIQSQFQTDKATSIAKEINADIIKVDPLSPNWYEMMLDLSVKMKKALSH